MVRKIIGWLFLAIASGIVGLTIGLIKNEDFEAIYYVASLLFIIFMVIYMLAFGLDMIIKGSKK